MIFNRASDVFFLLPEDIESVLKVRFNEE